MISIKKNVVLFCILVISISVLMHAQVGIGTTPPAQGLDVVGDIQFSGALMPNAVEGTSGQILLSNGPSSSLIWGAAMINQASTSKIKKSTSPIIPLVSKNGGRVTLTIPDIDCLSTSTCIITWKGPLPTQGNKNYFGFDTSYEAQNGQWEFSIINRSSKDYTDVQFTYVAFY